MSDTYNGWTNRETWLVNVHFDERVDELKHEASSLWEFERLVNADIEHEFWEADNAIYGSGNTGTEHLLSTLIRDMMPDMGELQRRVNVDELIEAWTDGGAWCENCLNYFTIADDEGAIAHGYGSYTCGGCAIEEEES